MSKAIGNFTPADNGELDLFTFDFATKLPPGNVIVASPAPVWAITVSEGEDPDAADHADGAPTIFGTKVTQKAGGFDPRVQYVMRCTITTNTGLKLSLWTFLEGEVVGC